jgi:hypothetical protein
MSIFFSPDEPKYVDPHSGRITRFRKTTTSTFSREKDNTLLIKEAQFARTAQVVPQCPELRVIRDCYSRFIQVFTTFNHHNGPALSSKSLSSHVQLFKTSFESYLIYSSRYFNSADYWRKVRRFSPLIQYSQSLVREWAIIVTIVNSFFCSETLPHFQEIQSNLQALLDDILDISATFSYRSYWRDPFQAASNFLVKQISAFSGRVIDIFENENWQDIQKLTNEIVLFSRDVHENFLGLIPSARRETPQMIRQKTRTKAAICNVVLLLEATLTFRDELAVLNDQMQVLHAAICMSLDKLGIQYEMNVAPFNCNEEVTLNCAPDETADQRLQTFTKDVGGLIHLDVNGMDDPVDRLDALESALRDALGAPEQMAQIEVPPPILPTKSRMSSRRRAKSRSPASMVSTRSGPAPLEKGRRNRAAKL